MSDESPFEIQCPVCGYYCLGNGGSGCIDKPALCGMPIQLAEAQREWAERLVPAGEKAVLQDLAHADEPVIHDMAEWGSVDLREVAQTILAALEE